MSRRFHVFVNQAAGPGASSGPPGDGPDTGDTGARPGDDPVTEDVDRARVAEIEGAFAAIGVAASVDVIDPADLHERMAQVWAARQESGLDAIVVAGGDGTVSSAAGAACEHDIVIGVLPAGTFNHFAKDLGIPTDLADAAAFLATASVIRVDVGDLGGRVFVNNSSIGVYPAMVGERDAIRERRGWGKVRAVPLAVLRTLRRLPVHRFTMEIDGTLALRRDTPFVFIGNGRFDDDGRDVGKRTSLDGAVLAVYVIATTSRWALIRNAWRARRSGIADAPHLERHEASSVRIRTADVGAVDVGLDGEVVEMRPPLSYRVRPAALQVLAGPVVVDAAAIHAAAPDGDAHGS